MNCSDYQMNSEKRSTSPHSPCSRRCYDANRLSKEKDMIISQLKAHIFELELREKDYNILNERFNQLQHDMDHLNDCKLQLECEKKLREDKYNKNINNLQDENETLQLSFNEKLSYNKDIFSENNCLEKQVKLKEAEICELRIKLNDLKNQLKRNDEDTNNLNKVAENLESIKAEQNLKISQLLEDNKTLKYICNDHDCCLKVNEQNRADLGKELQIKNNDIKNLNSQILKSIEEQNSLKSQLNGSNSTTLKFQNTIKGQEAQTQDLNCKNDILRNNLVKEKSARISEEQKNSQLSNIFSDREKKIDILNRDIDSIKRLQQNSSNKNCILNEENTKLRNHIMILTELNQNLINEIDNVIEEDEKMKFILNRKERINSVLASNRYNIDQSLNNLDEYINKGKFPNCINPCHQVYECH